MVLSAKRFMPDRKITEAQDGPTTLLRWAKYSVLKLDAWERNNKKIVIPGPFPNSH